MLKYQELSKREDFRDFIRDLVIRFMKMTKEHEEILFKIDNIYEEFAKCFINSNVDPSYNYELYELVGDTCLNNSVVMYLFTVLNAALERTEKRAKLESRKFERSPKLVDYYNKLKSVNVSTKEFNDIAECLGFRDFLQYNSDPLHESKFLADSFEAFVGCFEVMINRHISNRYSHLYIDNFISYLFESKYINYNPYMLYDPITLLKETNDKLRQKKHYIYKLFNQQNKFILKKIYLDYKNCPTGKEHIINDIMLEGSGKDLEIKFSRMIYNYLLEQEPEYIKEIPTPSELGIEELCE